MQRIGIAVAIGFLTPGCSEECLHQPCPNLPTAIEVTATSSSSGLGVTGTSIAVTGTATATVPCDSSCSIPVYAGTYTLVVTAPGYQADQQTVRVSGSSQDCGCPSLQAQRVVFALLPSS